jgi:predicted RNA-binding protein associated with RNAse of E/G family
VAEAGWVEILYRRLPDREQRFRQRILADDGACVVTFLEAAELPKPVCAGERVILEPGAPVVWFTFRGLWHDIGRFHLRDGTFTGFYANVLTPVRMDTSGLWRTTDLCLDVWLDANGTVRILDEDELAEAERRGWTDAATAARARREAAELSRRARGGDWPPAPVHEWTLEHARAALPNRDFPLR